MNKEAFIDTLRRALYGKVSDYELTDHVSYYEDYIRQEMNRGRSEQEVLEELGDPRLIARTILETSGMKAPEVEYTIDEEPADHEEGGVKVHAIYLLPVIIAVMLISWLLRKILR